MILVFLHYTTAAEQLWESPTTARHLSKGLEHRMSLHLHLHHSCPCTLHKPPMQIPVLRLLHLLKAVAACRFASPQLHFMPGSISSWAASFECDLQGLPEGPGFYPRQEQLRARLRSSMLPPQGCWDCRDTCPGGTLLHQTAAMPPSPKTQFLLWAFFFFFLLSSPHCGSFLVKLFRGTLYFSKNSDIIPIRW